MTGEKKENIEDIEDIEDIQLTVTKWYVQAEDREKAARFFGELGLDGFCAEADSMEWIRYRGSAPEQDRDELIHKVLRYQRDKKFKVVFLDENDEPLYKDELGWNIDVHLPAAYRAVMLGIVFFLGLLAFSLRNVEGANPALNIVCAAYTGPLAVSAFWGCRFRLTVEGQNITVRRAFGKRYGFSPDEITKVTRRVRSGTSAVWTDRVTVYAKSRRVSVNSYLTEMEKLDSFLLWHVSGSKIVTKEKKSRGF